jgi:hypothetical protein
VLQGDILVPINASLIFHRSKVGDGEWSIIIQKIHMKFPLKFLIKPVPCPKLGGSGAVLFFPLKNQIFIPTAIGLIM